MPVLVKEYLAGSLKVDEFVTHTLPLDKINDAFDLMHHGQRSDFSTVGSGVIRMDLLHFLAGCRTRRLNQA